MESHFLKWNCFSSVSKIISVSFSKHSLAYKFGNLMTAKPNRTHSHPSWCNVSPILLIFIVYQFYEYEMVMHGEFFGQTPNEPFSAKFRNVCLFVCVFVRPSVRPFVWLLDCLRGDDLRLCRQVTIWAYTFCQFGN